MSKTTKNAMVRIKQKLRDVVKAWSSSCVTMAVGEAVRHENELLAMIREVITKPAQETAVDSNPPFIPREEVNRNHLVFIHALDRAIEFHRTNPNDPHNVSNAVIVALSEVKDAFKAYM